MKPKLNCPRMLNLVKSVFFSDFGANSPSYLLTWSSIAAGSYLEDALGLSSALIFCSFFGCSDLSSGFL